MIGIAWRLLAVIVLLTVVLAIVAPTGRYLLRAGWEEGKILAHRRPIPEVIADPSTSPAVRTQLRLVLDARDFAGHLGLSAKRSFTTYTRVDHDTLVLVLGAAYRDQLRSYTWWFPIVGSVPYKGYFDFAAAERDAAGLRRDGFDAFVRPTAAFSTLGFFNDPLISSSLHDDSVGLANTVIHELTHNTYYAPNQAIFNESFANFVGSRGAEAFFRSRGDSMAARLAAESWADEKILGRFWTSVYEQLDSAFRAHPTDKNARLAVRDTIFGWTRERLVDSVGPLLKTYPREALVRARLDNAALLARRIYHTDLDLFDSVYALSGNDLALAVRRIITAAREHKNDGFAGLRSLVGAGTVRGRREGDAEQPQVHAELGAMVDHVAQDPRAQRDDLRPRIADLAKGFERPRLFERGVVRRAQRLTRQRDVRVERLDGLGARRRFPSRRWLPSRRRELEPVVIDHDE
jgi:predicted aminopeptidase